MRGTTTTERKLAARRCLTVIELLIALALLGAMAAIIVPVVVDRLDERAFEAAADSTSEQLLMARAHAQATGSPVEVTYSPTTRAVQARMYLPWDDQSADEGIPQGTSPLLPTAADEASEILSRSETTPERAADNHLWFVGRGDSSNQAGIEQGLAIAENWAVRTLGRGMRIQTQPSFAVDHGRVIEEEICLPDGTMVTRESLVDDYETLEDLEHGQEVRLAVFMPDGSAMVADDLWLEDDHGRCGKISINSWSGLPIFQRLVDLAAAQTAGDAGDGSTDTEDSSRLDPERDPDES